MSYIDWMISGMSISNCNCDYGCPCQFYAPPTYEKCEGVDVLEIDKGHFGDVVLDGLRFVMIMAWPGAIHEADGVGQVIVDQRADEAQREAIYKIASGEEQEPTTAFSIFASTLHDDYEMKIEPIELSYDLDARTATVAVEGVVKAEVHPIYNSVTGEPHYARLTLPGGFGFNESEFASSSFSVSGDLALDYKDRYAAFSRFSYGPMGIVN